MAAQPKHRLRTRTKIRRAAWNLKKSRQVNTATITCKHCGEKTPSHRACVKCGYYNGRLVKTTKAQVRKVT